MMDAEAEPAPANSPTPICAIGASAGGVTALQNLFRLLPTDLGLAYVVILHLAPDHPSALREILSACTRMPVTSVDDTPTLLPNQIFVIPPDRELVIEGDSVTARSFTEPRGHRAPIDMFFRSVAAARGDGIAVVLSGTGADGSLGVRATKEGGGVIMVQEPADAEFASMPQNAIATGLADVVAPIARLAERLVEVAHSKEAVRSLDTDAAANDLRRIVGFLRARTGHDFSSYKRATVMRRVVRRMQVCRTDTLGAYADYLLVTPEEARELFSDLLISVTMFFRDPHAFEALDRQVVATLFDDLRSEGEESIRVWTVGCATGEEAYAIAMLLHEEAARRRLHPQVQVFATDLDEGALATAREGRYPRSIEADVSEERLSRFFVDEGTHYRVRKELRESVLFAAHSVIKEPPFMRLDLISCRNLLIYLERAMQQQLCAIFHYALKPGRFLFLGSAETADVAAELFAPLDRDARLYGARPHAAQSLPILPQFAVSEGPMASNQAAPERVERTGMSAALHVSALESSAPPSALVDDAYNILHLSPSAGRFILHSVGPVSNLLPAVVRPELRLDLQLALGRALDGKEPTLTHPVAVAMEGGQRRVTMHVVPVGNAAHMGTQALVMFLDGGVVAAGEEPESLSETGPDELRRLHGELKATQEALVASRTGHEASIQDSRATNEELQSINEEYRSTAEELETSKEELQSINEELHTVNAELKSKLASISVAHSDLQNLTTATEIGTLFLDAELRIRMFTQPIAELFNVTRMDVGRPITDFTHQLDYDGLREDAQRVLRDLAPVEAEVRSRSGQWYAARLRPYRTVEDRIDGTVVTFVNVTARREAEEARRDSEERFRALVTAASYALYRMSPDWTEMRELDGMGFIANTLQPSEGWMERYIHSDDQAGVSAAIAAAIRDKRMFELEHRVRRPDGSLGWTLSRAVPVLDEAGAIIEWFGAASDVTGRRLAEQGRADSEQRLRTLMEGVPQLVWRADTEGGWTWASPQWGAYTGQSVADSSGHGWVQALHPGDRDAARAAWSHAAVDGLFEVEHRIRHAASGHYYWFQTRGVPVRDAEGRIVEWLGTSTDIDEQVRAREVLARSGEELERQVAERSGELMAAETALRQHEKLTAIGQLTGGIAHDFNNMLQALGSSLELARSELGNGRVSTLGVYLDRAERTTERAAALTHRMLTFARQGDLEPRAINIDRMVLGMEDLVRRTVGPGMQVELRLADGQWLVWCDLSQLENALLNLCINARDAMPDGGWLTIGTEEAILQAEQAARHPGAVAGRFIALSVRDTGSGIPPEVLDRVFEPFFSTKPIGAGTGLGLSQVHGFLHQSGGFVTIDTSTEPDPRRGTTVRLMFPFHSRDPDPIAEDGPEPSGPTLLLVEDQQDVRELFAEMLRARGYRVFEAEDGPAAARLINSGAALDLLLTDQGLPGGMTGVQIAAMARGQRPSLPVVLMTGFAELPDTHGLTVLRKPFKTPQLLKTIETLLAQAADDAK